MAKRRSTRKAVETITHDEAKRKNIPSAEYQSVLRPDDASPLAGEVSTEHRPRPPTRLAWEG